MTLILSGTNGVSDIDGDASTPALRGTDANSGIYFGSDTVGISAGGTQKLLIGTGSATIDGLTVGRGAGDVSSNTAVGASALAANTTGNNNTAVGSGALDANTTGGNNHAFGSDALGANTTGSNNCAFGRQSMVLNTTGQNNTAYGSYSLYSNTTGADNTAVGYAALDANTTGGYNTAFGEEALGSNTTAIYNTAVGYRAGYSTTTSGLNTFIGMEAGYNSDSTNGRNTFVGMNAGYFVTTGEKNTIIGRYNGNANGLDIRTSSNYIVLSDGDGNPRFWSNNLGRIYAPGVYGSATGAASNVVVQSDGQLERSTSSLKYKRDVQDATHGLAEVLQLRPVTYKGKGENDGETVFGGLIAEEVHDAGLTEFVQYNPEGEPDALAYGNMVSLCVKAIQELSAKNDALEARIAALEGN